MTTPDADVLIVGAGSAGLSAALMLVRSRRRVLVLDGGPPRNAVASAMHGVLGRDGWSPLALLDRGREEVTGYGGVIRAASAVEATHDGARFVVSLDDGSTVTARRLLIAGGLRDDLPPLPGLVEHWGRGVAHCPYCDGWEVRDTPIAVLATGPGSLHQAQLLRQLSPTITYLTEGTAPDRDDLAALTARGIALETRRAVSIESARGRVRGIRLADGDLLAVDAVFVRPRPLPADGLLRALGAATTTAPDGSEWVAVDRSGLTSVPGVWAAGNVVDPVATVPVSSAAGATAGAAINADLVADEVRSALTAHTEKRETRP